ncbi:MAG TPA: DUF4177 domain-containing protein [Pseudonocardiaceae bacterium]|nr:DUF4177 domain-containing protein [Pseudonocardiaceae bacterium]
MRLAEQLLQLRLRGDLCHALNLHLPRSLVAGWAREKILNEHADKGWQLKAITAVEVKGRIGPGGGDGVLVTFERPLDRSPAAVLFLSMSARVAHPIPCRPVGGHSSPSTMVRVPGSIGPVGTGGPRWFRRVVLAPPWCCSPSWW